MDNPAEKKIPEETIKGMKIKTPEETKKGEMELTDEEAEKVAGGVASFEFYDRENRKPK